MASHQFPVYTPDGLKQVASNYECESIGYPKGIEGDGHSLVLIRLCRTAVYVSPGDAVVFAELILSAVAVADLAAAKKLLRELD